MENVFLLLLLVSGACALCPSSCPGNWLSFKTAADLQKDRWGQYFHTIYGGLPPASEYPLCTGCLWMFYDTLVDVEGVTIPKSTGRCPANVEGQRYEANNIYQGDDVSWSWHAYPYKGFQGGQWVEVLHKADPFGDEQYGAWFLYAKGSGIWFDIGSTKVFREHQDAYTFFKITQGDYNEELSKAAAAQNFDSLQFIAHPDPVEYKDCDTQHHVTPGFDYMNIEIVGVKLIGTFACTSKAGAPPVVRSGWGGSQPCTCDNSKRNLNCKFFTPSPPPPSPTPSPPKPPPPSPPPRSHYGDPKGGCLPDELDMRIPGYQGAFCTPSCIPSPHDPHPCPTDVPTGVTAIPVCALQDTSSHLRYCALICNVGTKANQCGAAYCKFKSGYTTGVCTYKDTQDSAGQVRVEHSFGQVVI